LTKMTSERLQGSTLNGGSPRTLEVFVRLDSPAVVGGPKETWIESFDLEQYRDDATEEVLDENDATEDDIDEYADQIQDRMYELSGNDESQIAGAVRQAILDSGAEDVDVGAVLEDLGDLLFESEVSATELERELRDSDSLSYATDYDNGKLVSSQIIGRVFKNLGFDGIVMNKAGKRFPGMGISEDTVHVHVFPETPSQIKSVENRGTFDPSNPNILYQALREDHGFQRREPGRALTRGRQNRQAPGRVGQDRFPAAAGRWRPAPAQPTQHQQFPGNPP
jgi:hypothetical protein